MAVLAVAAAGAWAGSALFGAATFLGVSAAGWGWAVGAVVGQTLFGPRTNAEGPRLANVRFSQSSYGATLPIVMGAFRTGGNVIWAGQLEEIAGRQKVGKNAYATSYTYRQSFAVALAEGPVAGVNRIWFDSVLVYSATPSDLLTALASGRIDEIMTVHTGSETQLPDAVIESEDGAGNVPAYRGVCYVVFERLDLAQWGNRIPSVTAEVIEAASFSAPTLISENYVLSGGGLQIDGATFLSCQSATLRTRLLRRRDAAGNTVSEVLAIAHDAFAETDRIASPFVYICKNDPTVGYALVTDDAPDWPTPAYIRGVWTVAVGTELIVINDVEPATETIGDLVRIGNYLFGFFGLHIYRWPFVLDAQIGAYLPATEPDRSFDFASLGSISSSFGANLATDGVDLYARHPAQSGGAPIHRLSQDLVHLEKIGSPSPALQEGHFVVFDRMVMGFSTWFAESNYTVSQWRMNGDETLALMPGSVVMNTTAADGYLVSGGALAFTGEGEFSMVPLLANAGRTLAQVVAQTCGRVGLGAGEIDVTALSATVPGYLIDRQMSARAALEPVLAAYAVDAVESAGKLRFTPRGGAPVATIKYADQGAMVESGEPDDPASTRTREQSAVLPQAVAVNYADTGAAYEVGAQIAQRGEVLSDQQLSITLPLAIDADAAARAAHRILYEAWAGRTRRTLATDMRHAALEPADVVLIENADGALTRERIVSRLEDDGLLRFELQSDDDGVTVQVATGAPLPPPSGVIPPASSVYPVFFEAPPLRDEHASLLALYAVLAPYSTPWPGAAFWVNTPGDTDYYQVAETSVAGVVGQAMTALPAREVTQGQADPGTLDVRLTGGEPENVTESQWLSGRNLVLAGGELLRFREREAITGGWRLKGLLRHQHGTDYAASAHAVGEPVVLLDELDTAQVLVRPAGEIGAARHWRTPTVGQPVLEAPAVPVLLGGRTLRPLPPVHLTMVRQANGDRTIRWHRRTRAWQDWREAADIPLLEEAEQYLVEIRRADTGALLHEATVGSPSYTYTAAAIAADSPLPPTQLRVRVAQWSALVGAGEWADVTVPWATDFNSNYSRDWEDSSVAGMTAFGAGPQVTAETHATDGSIWPAGSKIVRLKNNFGGTRDVKARFDLVPAWRDGLLRVKVQFLSTTNRRLGLVARTTYWRNDDYGHGWSCVLNQGNVQLHYGANADSGALTQAASVAHGAADATIVDLAWLMMGNSHKVFVNGALKIDITDANQAVAGQCGLYAYREFSGIGEFDDFHVDF